MNSEQRRQRLNDLQTWRIAIPTTVYAQLDNDVPPTSLRSWAWSAYLWDRPTRHNWPYTDHDLALAQDAWDTAHEFVTGCLEREAERTAAAEGEQAERDAAFDAEKKSREQALTENLRRVYLAEPGTTPESFEKALPQLLEQRAQAATLGASVTVASPISRRDILA